MPRRVLQHVRPPVTKEGADVLYVKGDVTVGDGGSFVLEKGGVADFSTFFNVFSLSKWYRYTDIGNLFLEFSCKGKVNVEIIDFSKNDAKTIVVTKADGETSITIPVDVKDGMICARFTALEDSELSGIVFTSDSEQRSLKTCVVTCTYNRPEAVSDNVGRLLDFIKKCGGEFEKDLGIFVVNNGDIDVPVRRDETVRIFDNPNTGGSGGFSRGICEAYAAGYDRVVLMDDDITLDPEAIYRIWSFGSSLTDPYNNIIIGGTMLRADRPLEIHESTAYFDGLLGVSNDGGLVVSTISGCLSFDNGKHSDYNGWWLCSYPRSVANPSNLPLPLFMTWDDAEYGLRCGPDRTVSLNGVAVWHEPFDLKYSPARSYYLVRNLCVMHSVHGKGIFELTRFFFGWTVPRVFSMRYTDAEVGIRAMRDFLRGPDWLCNADPVELNSSLVDLIPNMIPYTGDIPSENENISRAVRWLTLNGQLLPSRGPRSIMVDSTSSVGTYRASSVTQIDGRGMCCTVERDVLRSIGILFRTASCCVRSLIVGSGIIRRYRDKFPAHATELSESGNEQTSPRREIFNR